LDGLVLLSKLCAVVSDLHAQKEIRGGEMHTLLLLAWVATAEQNPRQDDAKRGVDDSSLCDGIDHNQRKALAVP
jgi:hypothetical protein